MSKSIPRGIRNNNPGNIRVSATRWQGEVAGNDSAFETFGAPEYGIRAIAKLLMAYERRYGIDTPLKIAMRWAPPCENDTDRYAAVLAAACGCTPETVVNVGDHLHQLVPAIIKVENGSNPYPPETIAAGIRLAHN